MGKRETKREFTVTMTVLVLLEPGDTDSKIMADLAIDVPKMVFYETRDVKVVRKHRII